MMTKFQFNRLFGIAIVVALLLVSSAAAADDLGQSVVADGVLVYLGVVPSSRLRDDVKLYGAHNQQCPVPGGSENHHVMVALFDSSNGERITDADIYVRVSPLGLVGLRKHFNAVVVAGAMTYCNYFDLPANDIYNIDMDIHRVDSPDVIETTFQYRPQRG